MATGGHQLRRTFGHGDSSSKYRRVGTRIVTGDKEIDKALGEIAKVGTANRIARSGLLKSVRVVVKGIKAEIPGKQKSIKKWIKGYVKKGKKGVVNAKAGAVGKQPDAIDLAGQKRGDKEGVGITARNIHWYLIGTKRRQPKKKSVMKTFRGRWMGKEVDEMPAHPAVREGFKKTRSQAQRVLREGVEVALIRETARAKAKAGIR